MSDSATEKNSVKTNALDRHIMAAVALRSLDPEFAASAEAIYGHPYQNAVLSPLVQSLIVLAAETAIPQADEERTTAAMKQAIADGATLDDIMCTLEISCCMGIHTVSVGLPILLEEMANLGIELPPETQRQIELRNYIETSGPRPRPINSVYEAILRVDPEYFNSRIHYIDLPWERTDVLDRKTKHLICIAIDAISPQHYVDGLQKHIFQALEHHVTPAEILEVLELVSVTSLRTFDVALPIVKKLFPES